ncbi:MAG: hypothetical protein C4583_01450 [Anaerolineaceae bacterium]|nr:MAG: hypothetical protein C4583_01450 [Anaerolineaceae bacterium]
MTTRFATSPDSTRIAFDVTGAGTPLLLLHGGGSSRVEWHEAGYVARLGVFDPKSLSAKDQEDIHELSFPDELLPSVLAGSTAMLDWGIVTPADLLCPTLWLIGTENDKALESYREYEAEIPGSKVQVHLLEGLNHEQEFNNIKQVLPRILDFLRKS